MKTALVLLAAAIVLPGSAGAASPAPVPYDNNPAAGRYYDINGFRLYTETYGSGKPLLMIHGNNGNMSAFAANVPYFSAHYRVILADSRSQGKSVDPDHPLTFEMMADDFAALLDAMGVSSAYVIGWSDGGINALLLAQRHPEKVIALAATGANLWPTEDAFTPGLWAGWEKQHRETNTATLKTAAQWNDWKLFLLDYDEPHIAASSLSSVRCPCLIICGDHDLITVEHTAIIYHSLPRAYLWVVPDSGHPTLMEHSAEFNERVDAFFSTPFHERKG